MHEEYEKEVPMLQTLHWLKYYRGFVSQFICNIGENIDKLEKKQKYSFFFQNFKQLKQQHQINTLQHKNEKKSDIRFKSCLLIC